MYTYLFRLPLRNNANARPRLCLKPLLQFKNSMKKKHVYKITAKQFQFPRNHPDTNFSETRLSIQFYTTNSTSYLIRRCIPRAIRYVVHVLQQTKDRINTRVVIILTEY